MPFIAFDSTGRTGLRFLRRAAIRGMRRVTLSGLWLAAAEHFCFSEFRVQLNAGRAPFRTGLSSAVLDLGFA
jgi:hypothetical protein